MNPRSERLLPYCNTEGRGLEIGPSFNPIAPKRAGYHIDIMDHLDKPGLLKKYGHHQNMPENLAEVIEEVDFVWDGRRYPEIVDKTYDYILSAHLMEHVPDLIGHLNDCFEILNEGGVYAAVIPDKRYSFDLYRRPTTVAQLRERAGNTGYTAETVIDYYEHVIHRGSAGIVSWGKADLPGAIEKIYPAEKIAQIRRDPLSCDEDIHVSVFTPASFFESMNALYAQGDLKMPLLLADEDTIDGEFFCVFRKLKKGERAPAPVFRRLSLKKRLYTIPKLRLKLFLRRLTSGN